MKKLGTLICAMTVLLAACSQSQSPTDQTLGAQVPSSASPMDPAPVTYAEGMDDTLATAEESAQPYQGLLSLSLPTPQGTVTSSVRSDGSMLVSGLPVFPLGFYHLSWVGNLSMASQAERRLRDMNAMADLGMNTMFAPLLDPESDLPAFRTLLRAASTRGMKIIAEDGNTASVQALKSEPGLLGWGIADDCNRVISVNELQKRNTLMKGLDPAHFTYASLSVSYSNSWSNYFGRTDMMGNQAYPVGGGDTIDAVYGTMKILVREAVSRGTVPIANLQSFHWKNQKSPSTQQFYNMNAQALAAGVKGILYYTYLDENNDLSTNPLLLAEVKRTAGEIKTLTPVLLNGQRAELTTGNALRATSWNIDNRQYLVVVNTSETAKTSASFKLKLAGKKLSPLFAGRPTGLKLGLDGLTISGSLSALSAQWYTVE